MMYNRRNVGKKSVQKSIRMTEDVFNYINKFSGDGFQESFDNMISYFKRSEVCKSRRLKELEDEISKKNKELTIRQKFITDTLDIVDLCEEFTYAATILRQEVNSLMHIMNEDNIPFGENTT